MTKGEVTPCITVPKGTLRVLAALEPVAKQVVCLKLFHLCTLVQARTQTKHRITPNSTNDVAVANYEESTDCSNHSCSASFTFLIPHRLHLHAIAAEDITPLMINGDLSAKLPWYSSHKPYRQPLNCTLPTSICSNFALNP